MRKEIPIKDLVDENSALNTLPRTTLRSWGFDPDEEFMWYDDISKDVRVIIQEVEDFMGSWGERKNRGVGTTAEIEEAHRLFDEAGYPGGPLSMRAIMALARLEACGCGVGDKKVTDVVAEARRNYRVDL